MGGLACINCHTDRTKDLKPGRLKCLYCHSTDESIRNSSGKTPPWTLRFFAPDPATIKKAIKITTMQLPRCSSIAMNATSPICRAR